MYEYKKRIPLLFTGMKRKKRETAKIAWKSCDEELDSSFLATLFFLFLFDAMLFDMLFVWFSYVWIWWKQKVKCPFDDARELLNQTHSFHQPHTQPSSNFFYFYHKNDKTLTIGWILWLLFYILAHINVQKYRIILDTHWMCSV